MHGTRLAYVSGGLSGQVRSGQVRSGQVRSGQVRSGQVRSGQVRSGQVRSGQVRSGQVRSGQVRSGQCRTVQDTAWLSFHGILPTADRLVRFGMKVQPSCFCGAPESLVHQFVPCSFAVSVWEWFLPQFRKFVPNKVSFSTCEVLFGFSADPDVPVVFAALLGILRHQIWLTRNAHRFDQTSPDLCATLKKAKSTFRFLVRMLQRHFPEDRFSREWLADGVIGCINEHGWIHLNRDFIT